MRRPSLLALTIAVTALGWPAAAGAAAPLAPKEPVSAEVPKFQKAIADRSCAELVPLLTTISARPRGTAPGAPPAGNECDLQQSLFGDWAGYQPNRTQDFGTAALVDGRLKGIKEQIWILDSDGIYRFIEGLAVSKSDLASKLEGPKQSARTAGDLLAAVRRHSCQALRAVTLANGPLTRGFKGRQAFCKAVLGGFFASELKGTPRAKPVFEGGTGGIAFFYVETKHALTTVLVGRVAGTAVRFGVLDYAFNQRQ